MSKDFCDFGLLSRLAQAGGGGLLYDISLPKSQRPKLLTAYTAVLSSAGMAQGFAGPARLIPDALHVATGR